MSDSDFSPNRITPKKNVRCLEDSPSSSSTSSSGPVVNLPSRRRHREAFIEDDSDSDSGSFVNFRAGKRKVPRVASDADSDSSGSVIVKERRRPGIVASDSDNEDSDDNSSSQWETDLSDAENASQTNNTDGQIVATKIKEKDSESDFSDGQSDKCPICLLAITNQEIGSPEVCDHVFCVECIQEWSKMMNTCPVDRQVYRLILVRKSVNGKIYRQIPIQPPEPQIDLDVTEDPTFCEICGSAEREDRMLLCDGCDLGFHLECLTPPLMEVPDGVWYCNVCSPQNSTTDADVELFEMEYEFEGQSRHHRTLPRLMPRTLRSERVRRRIENNRNANQSTNGPRDDAGEAVTSTSQTRRRKPSRKKRKKRKKKSRRASRPMPNTAKKRLAIQLGMCRPRVAFQAIPDIKVQSKSTINLNAQRFQAGIPTVHLFGQRDELDYLSASEDEIIDGGHGLLTRRAPNRSDVVALRRISRVKSISVPAPVSSTTDVLGSILESQTKFHSKNTKFSLGKNGEFNMDNNSNHIQFNNYNQHLRQRPTTYSNNSTNDSVPSSSSRSDNYHNSNVNYRNSPSSSVEASQSAAVINSMGNNEEQDAPQDYSQRALPSYSCSDENRKENKKQKLESEENTPRSNTPGSESDVDIYSDIETVSTSKVDDGDFRVVSPPPVPTLNTGTDDDNNDSEPDMVIDTEKVSVDNEDTKEETAVTSTVDSNLSEFIPVGHSVSSGTVSSVNSTSEIQSQAIQSSSQIYENQSDNHQQPERENDDVDEEDGCPNFSIYSKESISLAKNTDISLPENDINIQNSQVGEVSSSPTDVKPPETGETNPPEVSEVNPPSTSEVNPPSTSEVNPPSTSEIKPLDTSEGKSLDTIEVKSPDASEVKSLDANDVKSLDTSENQSPDTNEIKPPETNEIKPPDAEEINSITSFPLKNSEGEEETNLEDKPTEEICDKTEQVSKKSTASNALYSDSEDETIVRKDSQSSFGILDIRNMTEDISEEERSYTPCLDEKPQSFKEGLEGLDTEMISDEEKNDFDESQELKTASDGDALEINAKESELDFTRPEDYEEGEIVDKTKNQKPEGEEEVEEEEEEGEGEDKNKENEEENTNTVVSKKTDEEAKNDATAENEANKESSFKKLSKSNKERNYRDKDKERDRSKSREKRNDRKSDKDSKREKKREKRKEIERYDVRALIAEKPRRLKDKFGRDVRRSSSRPRNNNKSVTPRRSLSRTRRSLSKNRRSVTPRRSRSKSRKSGSKDRSRKKRGRRPRKSGSRSRSRSLERRRSRSKTKKRKRSESRRRLSRDRSKKQRSRSRQRSKSPSRRRDWSRRHSRDWTPSLSRSPEPRHFTPSWTPPRVLENTVQPRNLTVILTNDANKKKKDKRKKGEKKSKENERQRKRKRDRTPPPSKEVFASGDNILVSVSFNKENETRDVSTKRRKDNEEALKKQRKERRQKRQKRNKDLSGIKPVAIIDLERSPFKEITPSPKDVIILSDSDNEEPANLRNMQQTICDSSQQVASPEANFLSMGPKTPPEPQVKFTLVSKQPQMRAISNPLHEPDEEEDIEPEVDTQEGGDQLHKGPNTPPEPPNSPPSSPDAYDPFEPTKSRSPTPEPAEGTQDGASENHETSIIEVRSSDIEKSTTSLKLTPDALKSHTPPLAEIQPADSQSSIHATPESNLCKSPDRSVISQSIVQTQPTSFPVITPKPVVQTVPFSSVNAAVITSTPNNSAPSRINILNTTIITPPHVASSVPQRIALPNTTKSSPVKISPTKSAAKSTPIKILSKGKITRKSRNQNGSGDNNELGVNFDSPYSPGSSDYEDLFEPPVEVVSKPPTKATKKAPAKIQNAFDALFGSSPFNKVKTTTTKNDKSKFKKSSTSKGKGTKLVGVKIDEDNLKILDELPNSAVEMQVKDKFLKKLNRQERVVEEVKLVLKPHYNKKHVNKEEYKDILRRSVPKICHNKSGEINPTKIKNLIEAYVKKIRHSKKVTSSSSVNNSHKA